MLHAGEHGAIRPAQLEPTPSQETAVDLREEDLPVLGPEECDTYQLSARPLVWVPSVF